MSEFPRIAKKIVLPCFTNTEICGPNDEGAVPIFLLDGASRDKHFERAREDKTGTRMDGRPKWSPSKFNFYPIVLDAEALPWAEANVYLLSRLENKPNPDMSTFDGLADDLVAYRRYIDDEEIDWRIFPKQKLSRPTYRYSAALERAIAKNAISARLAARRMRAVISFYKWLQGEGMFAPAYEPWVDKRAFLHLADAYGRTYTKEVLTTDISVKVPFQHDPYEGTIDDGGKLRPLSKEEQGWVLEALFARGNTEMTLIHLFSLLSGARIQTALTTRIRNLHNLTAAQLKRSTGSTVRIPVGLGTGIDTKYNKRMTLHLPLWFYQMLLTYSDSERARRRRALSALGNEETQYVFLTKSGAPFYSGKQFGHTFDANNTRRQQIRGNSVRRYILDVVIPYVRAKHAPAFRYQFHDLRASFGMNLTDSQLEMVAQGKRSLSKARQWVRVRMGHDSFAVTDRYLEYRDNIRHISGITDEYDSHLRKIAEGALKL